METEDGKLDSQSNLPCNTSYAQVVSKGNTLSKDISNNNPSESLEIMNGNEGLSNTTVQENSSTEPPMQNATSAGTAISHSDSLDDGEDSQTVDSSSTFKSSDFMINTTENSSILVTAEENKSTDQQENQSECSDSGDEADLEEDTAFVDDLYPSAVKWRIRSNTSFKLPETVTVLETPHGSKVFLVGTAHFSLESQDDVAKTIRAVQPDVVVIELCKSRVNILSLDEATILEESKNMNFQKIKATIEQNGFLQGVLYLLLLNMSAHLTQQLGMAPGGEFRKAYLEAKQIPGCLVHLGDRPIHVTFQRALAALSLWQKLRIAWFLLRTKDPISKEDVEKCKQRDLLEAMLAEMTGEFPELSHVFVKERDLYLTCSLQMAAMPVPSPSSCDVACPSYVVGVVGIGHVPGIQENWGKVTEKDISPILVVPEPSLTSKVVRKAIKYSFLGLCVYGVYKVLPNSLRPVQLFTSISETLNSLKK